MFMVRTILVLELFIFLFVVPCTKKLKSYITFDGTCCEQIIFLQVLEREDNNTRRTLTPSTLPCEMK